MLAFLYLEKDKQEMLHFLHRMFDCFILLYFIYNTE